MDNAVKDGVGQRAVIPSELLVPAFSMELRAENRGGFLPPAVQELKDILLLLHGGLQEKPLVQNEQHRGSVLGKNLLVVALSTRHIELNEQIGQPDIPDRVILLAGLHTKGTGHIGLAASGGPGNEDVPELRDVVAGAQPLNQRLVQLPSRCIVNVCNVGIRLVEIHLLNQRLQAVALPAAKLNINQHSKTVLKGDTCYLGVVLLVIVGVSHCSQLHLHQLVHSYLVQHLHYLL